MSLLCRMKRQNYDPGNDCLDIPVEVKLCTLYHFRGLRDWFQEVLFLYGNIHEDECLVTFFLCINIAKYGPHSGYQEM